MARSPLDNDPIKTIYNRTDNKRLALQRLLDSMPAQIDAIKEKKVCDAIELRRFMMIREADQINRREDVARRKYLAVSASALP